MFVVINKKTDYIAGGAIKGDQIICFPLFNSREDAENWLELELAEYDVSSIGADDDDFVVVDARLIVGGNLIFENSDGTDMREAEKRPLN